MKDHPPKATYTSHLLFPYEPDLFWDSLRQIIREELSVAANRQPPAASMETPGLTYKPLYKMAEVCALFQVSKPTLYEWVKLGKLKPYKIRSRVYFLSQDIQQLLRPKE